MKHPASLASPIVWPLLLLAAIEIYCMFPFEDKGDFASIGRFVVNSAGSIAFIVRSLMIGFIFSITGRRRQVLLLTSFFTPALVFAFYYISDPLLAVQRVIEAYSAGPLLIGGLFGAN